MSGIYGTRDLPARISSRSASHPATSISNGTAVESDDALNHSKSTMEAKKIPYKMSGVRIERRRVRSGTADQDSDDDAEGNHVESAKERDLDSTSINSVSDDALMEKEITETNYRTIMQQLASSLVEKETLSYQVQILGQAYGELKNQLIALAESEKFQPSRLECLRDERCHLADFIIQLSAVAESDNAKKPSVQSSKVSLQRQLDLWKNKFLANSLIVDELSNQRQFLIGQMKQAQEVLSSLLAEKEKIREGLFETFLFLQETKETLDPLDHGKYRHLVTSHSVVDLLKADQELGRDLHRRLLNTTRTPSRSLFPDDSDCSGPNVLPSEVEEQARKIIATDITQFGASNPCEDFQHLISERAKKLDLPPPKMHNIVVNCCKRCEGQIKVV